MGKSRIYWIEIPIRQLRVNDNNEIEVMFTVRTALAHKVRFDSKAKVIRSFIIGEKRIEVTPGSKDTGAISNYGTIEGVDSREITDLLSGKNISDMVGRIDTFLGKMDVILETLAGIKPEDIKKTSAILYPTLNNLNLITQKLRIDLVDTKILQKGVTSFEKIATPVAKRQKMIHSALNNIERISKEIESNKRFTHQISGALRELIITLKAVQKTWMLSEYVDEVKSEKKSSGTKKKPQPR